MDSFVCRECGHETNKWSGKCPNCHSWNSLTPIQNVIRTKKKSSKISNNKNESPLKLSTIDKESVKRLKTGIAEFDNVLGGGLIPGMVSLIGGEPGVGKSTLLLQIASRLSQEKKCLYVSGEESKEQIKLRNDRLGLYSENLLLFCEVDAEKIIKQVQHLKPDLLVIDSIQSIYINSLDNVPGSVTQLREITSALTRIAKQNSIPTFLIGHVTKGGIVAGPKIIEHMVDTVLYFESDLHRHYKILRAIKNRFGSTNEIGVFEMLNKGLSEVKNPSKLFIENSDFNKGKSIGCILEGSRPFLVEIQAMVT